MFTRLTISALLTLGCYASVEARNGIWADYRDPVYACRVEYPTTLFKQADFDATEKFQRFSGPDAQTYFRVMGVDNSANLTPTGIKAKYLEAKIDGRVVYQVARPNFLVLSGYRGDSVFYTKVALSSDNRRICILEITYAREDKAALDDAVSRMSHSFVAGKLDASNFD